MRDLKTGYINILELQNKINKTIQSLEKRNLLNKELKSTLLCVRNMDELELVVCIRLAIHCNLFFIPFAYYMINYITHLF